MKINAGQLVREVFKSTGLSVTELGKRVGTTRQNIYRIFDRKSIDSALLFRLGKAMSYDFYKHFSDYMSDEGIKVNNVDRGVDLQKEVDALKGEVANVSEKYEMLKRLNELLEKKVEK